MIRVNTSHIEPEGLALNGEEDSAVLELSDPRTGKAEGPLRYALRCCMAGRDLVVTGSAKVKLKAECSRCLKESSFELSAKEICHHYEEVSDKEIDLGPDLREDVLLALPSHFLCSGSCKGLCPSCGADLNEGACSCGGKRKRKGEDESDGPSAWDALDRLKI